MDAPDDASLLDQFAATGSHEAFAALVKRHADWVYATARRRTGSADLAEDVTQATFIVLAKKAGSVGRRESLAAWLYRVARYAALDALRRRSRRDKHERRAARQEVSMPGFDDESADAIAPHLDAILDRLPARDREAIVLYYFDNRTLQQIGDAQRVAASTVQRRLNASLGRIGYELKRRGVAPASATALAAAIATVSTLSAPPAATAGLTALATASGALPATTAGPIGLAKGTMKAMTLTKLKLAAAAIAGAVTLGTGGVVIEQAIAQSRQTPPGVVVVPPAAPTVNAATPTPPADGLPPGFFARFTSQWTATSLNVNRGNPRLAGEEPQRDSQTLSVRLSVTVSDTTNVLGFDNGSVAITRVVDDAGRDLSPLVETRGDVYRNYRPLEFNFRYEPQGGAPTEVLRPASFDFPLRVTGQLPERIAEIGGTVRALVAERIETVDLPYKVTTDYTEIVPGRRLRFDEAAKDGGVLRYRLSVDGDDQPGRQSFTGTLREGDRPPERFVVHKYLIDETGKPLDGRSRPFGSFANAGGESGTSGGRDVSRVTAMRFEVAVNPQEVSIPVLLKDVDLPQLKLIEKTLPTSAAPSQLSPVQRMESALQRQLQARQNSPAASAWTETKSARVRELWTAFLVDFDRGAVPVKVAPVMGVTSDVKSYDDYLGIYSIPNAGVTTVEPAGQGSSRPATRPTPRQDVRPSLRVTVRKDERGRFLVDTPEGPSPAVARDGALFAVFDDVLIAPSDRLDPKSEPKLAGFWMVRSGGRTTLLMDTGRPMPPLEMVREAKE